MGRGGSRTGGAGLATYLYPKSSGQRRQILEHYQIIVTKVHMALGRGGGGGGGGGGYTPPPLSMVH